MAVKLFDKRESAVEQELVVRVRKLGGVCEKVTVIGARGFFDRLVVLPGLVAFCEIKRPRGGRLSPHQMERVRAYTALGAVCCVIANSADIDRLLRQSGPPSCAQLGGPESSSHARVRNNRDDR
jgi:hypothetical protein